MRSPVSENIAELGLSCASCASRNTLCCSSERCSVSASRSCCSVRSSSCMLSCTSSGSWLMFFSLNAASLRLELGDLRAQAIAFRA